MNVLFVSYHDFRCNSLTHIAGFAAGLQARDHECAVAVPDKPETISAVPSPTFIPLDYRALLRRPACFPDGRAADIIHAWTPRQHVADLVYAYQRRLASPARLVIHLEDNEEYLAEEIAGDNFAALRARADVAWRKLRERRLIHPQRHRLFLHAADRITHITPTLATFAPAGTPVTLLRPGAGPEFFAATVPALSLREELGLAANTRLVVYTGGANPINAGEIRDLYRTVVRLNADGVATRLIRTGASPRWFVESLTAEERTVCADLGFVDRRRLPGLLAQADALIQPGRIGPFNDYRLPSKLPEFLAAGRPVIMPATNIAQELREGRDALFLHEGSPAEMAARCREVFADPELAARLSANARDAAARLFSLEKQCRLLADAYADTMKAPPRAAWNALAGSRGDESLLFAPAPGLPEDLHEAVCWMRRRRRPWWRRLFDDDTPTTHPRLDLGSRP